MITIIYKNGAKEEILDNNAELDTPVGSVNKIGIYYKDAAGKTTRIRFINMDEVSEVLL